MSVFLIAFRNLTREKGRLLITAGGVAFSVILILVLLGLYFGWQTQMTRFLGNIDTDFWVGQKGSRDMSHTVSILPASMELKLKELDGVSSVTPFIGRQASFNIAGKEAHFFLIGMDPNGAIKPYRIIEGKEIPGNSEIIIDQTFAKTEKLTIGDELTINSVKMKVAGISSGGNLLVYSYAFTNANDAKKILDSSQFVNYYLVKTHDKEKAEKAISAAFPNLGIIEKQDFLSNNTKIITETFLPIIGVLLTIAVFIGIAVIGLTIFTATVEKSREFGVLKAIGYKGSQLYAIALIQAVLSGIIGFVVGLALIPLIVKLAEAATSAFIYEVDVPKVLLVLAAVFAMSTIASLIPLKRIISIDPAEVFKA
ncbi:MAG: ABC transporter permease [Patescibacteria group bacterium]|nr:ABC transporter permease [Patescibacteria group bacterium]